MQVVKIILVLVISLLMSSCQESIFSSEYQQFSESSFSDSLKAKSLAQYSFEEVFRLNGSYFGFGHNRFDLDEKDFYLLDSLSLKMEISPQGIDKELILNFGYVHNEEENGGNWVLSDTLVIEPDTEFIEYNHKFEYPVVVELFDSYNISTLDSWMFLEVMIQIVE